MKPLYSFFLICLIISACTGCMHKQDTIADFSADNLWMLFQQKQTSSAPVMLGSLRFGIQNDTRRVTYMLWSVGKADDVAERIRLEINAGAGTPVCSAMFEDDRMTILLHQEARAVTGYATKENLKKILGISLPFEIRQLKQFLCGNYYHSLNDPTPKNSTVLANGSVIYHIEHDGADARLELNASSLPTGMITADGWDLTFAYGNDSLPVKMMGKIKSADGDILFHLLVKSRSAFTKNAEWNFDIPAHYQRFFLDAQ